MKLNAALTAIALVGIGLAFGGAVVRVAVMAGTPAPLATLCLASLFVVAGLVWGDGGRGSTPYWS